MVPGSPVIHVVAAAVTRPDGRVLIAQRPPGKHLAGGWEFPGGKLEPGETRSAGLARELREELGIAIREPRPLLRVRHAYAHGAVLIDMWVVSCYGGEPRGLDGQALRWCLHDELEAAELLPADRPLVRALRLPERLTQPKSPHYEVTGARRWQSVACRLGAGHSAAGSGKLQGVCCAAVEDAARAVDLGADFLVMERPLPPPQLERLCGSVPLPVFARGLTIEAAWTRGATGLSELRA
jgi:mutator protein MutT